MMVDVIFVIPAEAGIQSFLKNLDARFHEHDIIYILTSMTLFVDVIISHVLSELRNIEYEKNDVPFYLFGSFGHVLWFF